MKLPWDRNWFKCCFYLIITFTIIYLIKLIIDMCAYTLANVSGVTDTVLNIIKKLAGIFAPVLIALAAAYVLEPPVRFIRERVKSRRIACIIVFALIVLPPVIFCVGLALRLKSLGLGSIADGINICISICLKRVDVVYMHLSELLQKAGLEKLLQPYIAQLLNEKGNSIFEGGNIKLFFTCAFNFMLGMVMAFYLLIGGKSISRLGEVMRVLLPPKLYLMLKIVAEDIDAVFSGYIRGQLTDGLIMAFLIGAGLWLVKIPFAPFIGIVSGFSNIVPYFGSLMGFFLTAFAALISGDTAKILYGFGVMIILQQIDSVYIVPKVVGKRVEISPFGVIAALTVGGKLFGLWGMVLAVPVTAVGKVLVSRWYERKTRLSH